MEIDYKPPPSPCQVCVPGMAFSLEEKFSAVPHAGESWFRRYVVNRAIRSKLCSHFAYSCLKWSLSPWLTTLLQLLLQMRRMPCQYLVSGLSDSNWRQLTANFQQISLEPRPLLWTYRLQRIRRSKISLVMWYENSHKKVRENVHISFSLVPNNPFT